MLKTVNTTTVWKGEMKLDAQAGNHIVRIDQPEEMGGEDSGANPMEYFLFSLGSCLGTVAAIVAKQERIELRDFSIELEGDYDMDFLMGKTMEGISGFTEIRGTASIDADLSEEEKADFFEKVHSRCPVTGSIIHETKLVIDVN